MAGEAQYLACGCPARYAGDRTAGAFRIRYSRYLPCCAAGVHRHDEARIVLPLSGALSSSYVRRTIPIGVGAALYRPRGEDHLDRYEAPTDCVSLLLPDSEGFRRIGEPAVVQDPALARAALVLRTEAETRDTASGLVAEGVATLISAQVLGRAPLAERGVTRWVGAVRERLDAACEAPPSLAELARGVQRAPAHVATTFRRAYGVSVGGYVRRVRLWHARDRIDADPSARLSQVAQDCGFADQSHFNRHFARLFGLTPGAYRTRRQPGRRR